MSEQRLIDANALKRTIAEIPNAYYGDLRIGDAIEEIDAAPTIEPPVVHARSCDNCRYSESLSCDRCYGMATLGAWTPKIEPLVVLHGKWEQRSMFDEDAGVYVCSNCDEPWVLEAGTPEETNMNFCPNCGARMYLEATE